MPNVSFEGPPCSDWKPLPELVANGFNWRANVVFCTQLDQVSQENMDEQLKIEKDILAERCFKY
jgi:hypothetical protein